MFHKYVSIYFGIGLPISSKNMERVNENKDKVDFVIDSDGEIVKIYYQKQRVFDNLS